MKKKKWLIGIIIVVILCLAVISLALLNLFPIKHPYEIKLTQAQAVMLTKNACEIYSRASYYTEKVFYVDTSTKTYEDWQKDVDIAVDLWNEIGTITVMLEYNDGISMKPENPIIALFYFIPYFENYWVAGNGDNNIADKLSMFANLLDNDRGTAYTLLKEVQKNITHEEWENSDNHIYTLVENLRNIRENRKVQTANMIIGNTKTVNLEIWGVDSIIFIDSENAFIVSDSEQHNHFNVDISVEANLWQDEHEEYHHLEIGIDDVLILETKDESNPKFLEINADELFNESLGLENTLEINMISESIESNSTKVDETIDIIEQSEKIAPTESKEEDKQTIKWVLDKIEYQNDERYEDDDNYDFTYEDTESSFYYSEKQLFTNNENQPGYTSTRYIEWTPFNDEYLAGEEVDITVYVEVTGGIDYFHFGIGDIYNSFILNDVYPKSIANNSTNDGFFDVQIEKDSYAEGFYKGKFPADDSFGSEFVFEIYTEGLIKYYYYKAVHTE